MKPKLVLYGYLVPQLDTTIVSLTNSAPLFTSNPRKIETVLNATVEISENNTHWVKMEYDAVHKHYFITQDKFPIIEGKTYYIRASASGFETVSSSCRVPYLRETNLDLVFKESINDYHYGQFYNWPHYHSYIEWTDYPGEENYYMFYYRGFYSFVDWNYYGESVDTSYYFGWGLQWSENEPCIYSDYGQDGKKMSVLMMDGLPGRYEMTLLQTDKNCYLFEKSLIDLDSDMQFFMLEPNQIYSNVKNGYGLFGAFVMRDYVWEFEEDSGY